MGEFSVGLFRSEVQVRERLAAEVSLRTLFVGTQAALGQVQSILGVEEFLLSFGSGEVDQFVRRAKTAVPCGRGRRQWPYQGGANKRRPAAARVRCSVVAAARRTATSLS